ncbi:RNA-directed DNA polymerase, eukaryota, reverse transcriptase zinc-binding domain protein [Tanacetum coccineum]
MNPEPKVVIKHGKMLYSGQVNVKKGGMHSGAKEGVIGIVDKGMEDGFDGEESMKAGDDVTKDGLVSEVGLEEKEVRDEVRNKDDVVKGVFGNEPVTNVSDMFPELNSASLDKKSYKSSVIFDSVPEIPPPVKLNPILNPNVNLAGSDSGDLLGNLGRNCWGNNNVRNMRNSKNEFGMTSGVRDFEMQENSSFKKAISFSNAVQGTNFVGDNKLKLVPCATKEGRKVMNMDPVIEEGSKKWGLTVVGHFVWFKMSYREIVGHLKRMWRSYQLDEIIVNEGGLYFFKFKSEDGLQNVIENGPRLVDQKPLFLQRWVAGICLEKHEPVRIPLWVKIYNVPLEALNVEGISIIASRIGTPIIMDKVTTSMCERGYGRASFARVLIEVNATEGIVDNVEICFKGCNNRPLSEEEKTERNVAKSQASTKVNDEQKGTNGWQSVPSRKFTRPGGQGSFNGRGGFNNVQVNDGKRYVPMKNMAKEKTSDMEGMNKQEMGKEVRKDQATQGIKINIDVACDMGIPIGEEESVKWPQDLQEYYKTKCDSMEKKAKIELLQNRIKILEGDISTSKSNFDVNVTMKAKENVVAEMENSGSSRNQAFDFVYTEAYSKEFDRIEKLILKKQLAEVELFILSKKPLDDKVKEGWTDEMLEFYEANSDLNDYDINEKNKKMKFNDAMDDKVSEDFSAHANFMTQNVVSSIVDASMAYMVNNDDAVETRLNKKLVSKACNNVFGRWIWVSNVMDASRNCRIIVGWDPDMVDAVLLSSYGQVMHFEVMMGDFNAILYFEDHSKGFANVYQGIREFRSCVQQLDMKDLARNRLFYTWVQKSKNLENGIMKKLDKVMGNSDFLDIFEACYANFLPNVTFDHCPALLVIPCSATKRKRLKNMKRHIRELNKRNGNVFEKVKKLRDELKKIQTELDKDPQSVDLKEAEMVINSAYSDAVMDEEKGRLSRNRIISVEDDVGIMFYNDDVAPIFVDHFESFFGTCEETFPVEDPDGLFIKKIDAVSALYMVRDVSNEEIKAALFDIDDNKAPGPDGFTSRFFKASWEIIGKDFCSAIKEFFISGKMLGELNTTLISLIPKCNNPVKVADYRPIACCTVVYKCITKVISNRIKVMLNGIIDSNQSAFIEGRQISDNIISVFSVLAFIKPWLIGLWYAFLQRLSLFALMGSLMVFLNQREVCNKAKFKYHWGCKGLGILNLCFSDDLMLFCHGDMVSASVLRRALDEFCLSSGLRPNMAKKGSFPIRYLGIPLNVNRIVRDDCTILLDKVKKRVEDWRNKSLSFAGRLQLIAYVLSSLNVFWASMFILPQGVCDEINKIFKEFLWKSDGKRNIRYMLLGRMYVCRKVKDLIWVKWVKNHYLMDHSVWDMDPSHHSSWVWKQILALRNKIRGFVKVKISNDRFILSTKVANLVENGMWIWPTVWDTRFKDVLDIPVPTLSENNDEKVIWINKKGKEKNFNVNEVWKDLKANPPKVLYCTIAKRLWERLKGMARLEYVSNSWPQIISSIVNLPAKNTIWSVIQRLVLGASVYYIWQERNIRLFGDAGRSNEVIFKLVVEAVRLRVMGLKLKVTNEVIKASEVWNFPIDKMHKYKCMIDDLMSDMMDINDDTT